MKLIISLYFMVTLLRTSTQGQQYFSPLLRAQNQQSPYQVMSWIPESRQLLLPVKSINKQDNRDGYFSVGSGVLRPQTNNYYNRQSSVPFRSVGTSNSGIYENENNNILRSTSGNGRLISRSNISDRRVFNSPNQYSIVPVVGNRLFDSRSQRFTNQRVQAEQQNEDSNKGYVYPTPVSTCCFKPITHQQPSCCIRPEATTTSTTTTTTTTTRKPKPKPTATTTTTTLPSTTEDYSEPTESPDYEEHADNPALAIANSFSLGSKKLTLPDGQIIYF